MCNRNWRGLVVILLICLAFLGCFVFSFAATEADKAKLSNAGVSTEKAIDKPVSEKTNSGAEDYNRMILEELIKQFADRNKPVTRSIMLITAFATVLLAIIAFLGFYYESKRTREIDREINYMKNEVKIKLENLENTQKLKEEVSTKVKTELLNKIYSTIQESVKNAVWLEVSAALQELRTEIDQEFRRLKTEYEKQRNQHLLILNLLEEAKYNYLISLEQAQIKEIERIMPRFSYALFQCLSKEKNVIWTGINTLYTLKDSYKVNLPKAVYEFLKILHQTRPELQDNEIKEVLKRLCQIMHWDASFIAPE